MPNWLSCKSGEREEKFNFQSEEGMGAEFVSHPAEGNPGEFPVDVPKTIQVPGQQILDKFPLLPGAELPSFPTALSRQVQSSFLLDLILSVLGAHSPGPWEQLELGQFGSQLGRGTIPTFPGVGRVKGPLGVQEGLG